MGLGGEIVGQEHGHMCRESHHVGCVLGFSTHQSFPGERDMAYMISWA